MAFGRHWEWRGFARGRPRVLARIEALPAAFSTAQRLSDRYLWYPGCAVNVKLRENHCKLKRRLDVAPDGLEEWIEDEAENYAFPLDPSAVREIVSALGGACEGAGGAGAADETALLEILTGASSRARIVEVEKSRRGHRWPDDHGVLVEVAEIRAPERVLSVSIEDSEGDDVRAALAGLGLPGDLWTMSYLDALDAWGRGRSLGETQT